MSAIASSPIPTPGGSQSMLTVTEPGLYRTIFKSRKPVAKRFQRWVFHEVLPSVRQTGSYALPKQDLVSSLVPSNSNDNSNQQLNVQDQLAVISYVFDGFVGTGVDPKLVESAKSSAIAAQFPTMIPALSAAKESLMLQTPDEGTRYNVTDLGKMLAQKLGLDKDIKATQINEALQQVGFQVAQYRIGSKGTKHLCMALNERRRILRTAIFTVSTRE